MKSRSKKNKGKRLQNWVVKTVLAAFEHLHPDDIQSRTSGDNGEDIPMSPLAREAFPYAVECKNQERISIWASLDQCSGNCGDHEPLLIFKRNHSQRWAVVRAEHLIEMRQEIYNLKRELHHGSQQPKEG